MSGMLEFECEFLNETDYAWLVEIEGSEVWLPKSQCEYDDCSVRVPRWLAEKKDLT